jgi:protein-disulfide isomerase
MHDVQIHRALAKNNRAIQDRAIHDYIVRNPKVIVESVEKYFKEEEAKQQAAAPKERPPFNLDNFEKLDPSLVQQIVNDKTNYSLGNKDGKFVIIEFFDYNCGWCKRTNAALKEALAKPEAKNIRWVPIDTPIFGEGSETIARFVLAAGKQGKYAAMHDAVGDYKGKVDEAALMEMGKKIGLNTDKMKKDADSQEIKDKLVANREFTRALNIGGVPMLIVNGNIHPGALFGEELDEVVAESAK